MIIQKESSEQIEIGFEENYKNILADSKLKLDKYKENIFYDEYTYVEEYLQKYEFYIKSLSAFSKYVIILLAAAVSDYYIPYDSMNEHKIQSSENNLNICLFPVKKELYFFLIFKFFLNKGIRLNLIGALNAF